jgi:hypothetical protein
MVRDSISFVKCNIDLSRFLGRRSFFNLRLLLSYSLFPLQIAPLEFRTYSALLRVLSPHWSV